MFVITEKKGYLHGRLIRVDISRYWVCSDIKLYKIYRAPVRSCEKIRGYASCSVSVSYLCISRRVGRLEKVEKFRIVISIRVERAPSKIEEITNE